MARKSKKSGALSRRKKLLGGILFLLSLLILVSLVTHRSIDDARIAGEVDSHLNPFELQYRNQGGMMGAYLAFLLTTLLGWLSYFVPLSMLVLALRLFSADLAVRLQVNGFLLFVISLCTSMIYNVHLVTARTLSTEAPTVGGYVGEKLTELSVKVVGGTGSYLVLAGVVLLLIWMYTSITPLLAVRIQLPGAGTFKAVAGAFGRAVSWAGSLMPSLGREADGTEDDGAKDEENEGRAGRRGAGIDDLGADNSESVAEPAIESDPPAPRRTTLKKTAEQVQVKSVKYTYPGEDLLQENPVKSLSVNAEETTLTARMLKETLETFGVGIEGEIESFPGPVITRYEFKPGIGIKVNQIVNLSDDLALALRAKRIRIVAPIPGKAAVGVEIPNRSPQSVYLRDIIASDRYRDPKLILPLALGKTISGKPFIADLAKMPHLLIAGATGSGKSVCMNVLITSLIYRLHPLQVRFIFIDPKMLELSVYSGIPHLGRPVVTKPNQAERVLTDLVREMESRYRRLAEASVRNIEDFNKKQKQQEDKLPYIIVFVDELADLMMASTSTKTEVLITRLAQMARAVGIHLILATQRPSVDVITGLIKANFPARIAFQVSSKVDSRTIIDANGAEKLLGSGDMLYLASGQPETLRVHGAWISSDETERIVAFIREQGLEMMALSGISQSTSESSESEVDLGDPLFREACEVVVRHKQGSVSLLQRRLGIGYQRAARLIDKLEQAGIVSSFDGSKAREVVVDKAYVDALFAGSPTAVSSSESDNN
ncbi:MAG: DNA translocase FtsK 4TM domain-containing protein [candidate division Zixibacteria bacterium]|jgi:S-DNA-T family DNA segregation ATPase FtsK/SpoIIIE|nr:DNA translocase FtsK 4TM domain-containing protein [candidate division Zixibacteria bacterium]